MLVLLRFAFLEEPAWLFQVSVAYASELDLPEIAANAHLYVMLHCFLDALEELVLMLQVFVAFAFELELVLEAAVGQKRKVFLVEEGENEVEEAEAMMSQTVGVV